jgi:hypothetical protein
MGDEGAQYLANALQHNQVIEETIIYYFSIRVFFIDTHRT